MFKGFAFNTFKPSLAQFARFAPSTMNAATQAGGGGVMGMVRSALGSYGLSAAAGAGVGAAYGAFSDNTSVLGGALGGAGLGAGGLFAGRFAKNMAGYYGLNGAKAQTLAMQGMASARNMGARLWSNRPFQKI